MTIMIAEAATKTYNAICFSGHSPAKHADSIRYLLTDQVKQNVVTKTLSLFAQILLIKKNSRLRPPVKKIKRPGLPKLVPLV